MKKISVYLSSTDFHEGIDEMSDVNWKTEIQKASSSLVDSRKYEFSYYDPLEIISDKPGIVSSDIRHISWADFVICYLPKTKLTIGTLMELQYACLHKSNESIILIDRYKIHRNHPWIKYWVKNIVNDEAEAVKKMTNIIG